MSNNSQSLGCIGLFLFGFMFTGAGVMCLMIFAKLNTLDCQRVEVNIVQGDCKLTSTGIFSSDEQTIPIASLNNAIIEESHDDEGDTTYRVVLLTKTGSIPFTTVYSSGRAEKQEKVRQINSFIENTSQTTLNLKQDDRLIGYIFGGVFGGIGVLTLFHSVIIAPLKMLLRKRIR